MPMKVLTPPRRRHDAWPPPGSPRAARLNDQGNHGLPFKFASMQGMGDNIHQRAIVRQLMQQNVVYLDTPWPAVYHDLVGLRLVLVRPAATTLRTQAKNVLREASQYQCLKAPRQVRMVRTWYRGEDVRREGSILAAMVRSAGCSMPADFRLPVPQPWLETIDAYIRMWAPTKPIMLYRPLVERTEWAGCAGRNPDERAYQELFQAIRHHFFVISVADLVPGKEWLVQRPTTVDVELHGGELSFELLAALAKRSAMVFCSAGFAPILAQAVGTPVVCVFGGHESSMTIKDGATFAPTLGIDPMVPCNCFDHQHAHHKEIDMFRATERLDNFIYHQVYGRKKDADLATGRLETAVACHQLAWTQQALHERGGVGSADRPGEEREPEGGA